ncbi:hypothetical protein BEN47_14710 [Hymenobacter lapidarius]|uniref:Secretion system C-terminal sorting domain-containing protein n=1 Tax=Hymenobacter lapidarius TaxID=1908237 RepID=A0A1G1T3K4_9BACT|nr:hypothetical protein BEN47_14710 [Hymenobacter lapidarius]
MRVTSGTQTATANYYGQPQQAQAVYPNPADSYVEIGSEEQAPDEPSGFASQSAAKAGSRAASSANKQQKPMHISVHNGQGKEIFKAGDVKTATLRVNTQAWPAGLYQVTVQRDKTLTRRQLSIVH